MLLKRKRMLTIMAAMLAVCAAAWPEAGAYNELGSDWKDTAAMIAVGDYLYIISEDALWKVDTDGNYEDLGDDWVETAAMAAIGDYLYIVSEDTLWKVDTGGSYEELG